MKPKLILTAASLALTALCTSPALAADAPKPSADTILRQMSSTLAGARQFSFHAHRTIDAALLTGRKVPADAQIAVTVQRPNKITAKSVSNGDVRHFYAGGRNLTLVDVTKNLYATVPMPTSLDGLVAELDQKYGFTPPLAELALSNVYADIRWKAQSISYLGDATGPGGFLGLSGVPCHRLALSGKVLDAELWVGVNDHLPKKLVATAKNRPGKPQIKVAFSDWNLAPKVTDQDFAYVPSKGAMKITIATTAEVKTSDKNH